MLTIGTRVIVRKEGRSDRTGVVEKATDKGDKGILYIVLLDDGHYGSYYDCHVMAE